MTPDCCPTCASLTANLLELLATDCLCDLCCPYGHCSCDTCAEPCDCARCPCGEVLDEDDLCPVCPEDCEVCAETL